MLREKNAQVLFGACVLLFALADGRPVLSALPAVGTSVSPMWGGACGPFQVVKFPTLPEIIASKGMTGADGGEWTACTHLQRYGLNLALYFLRFLAFELKPKTALEFGCGLGTTADYLARFSPGGAAVTCLEPEPMLGEVFDRHPTRSAQLAVDVFTTEGLACRSQLSETKFDLVYSVEVAEHVSAEHHPKLVKFLAEAVAPGGRLVFSAARKGQGGTGHIDASSRSRKEWEALFAAKGLELDNGLSQMARRSAYPERSYDIYKNVFVMRWPSSTSGGAKPGRLVPSHGLTGLIDRTAYFPFKFDKYELVPNKNQIAKGQTAVTLYDDASHGGSDIYNLMGKFVWQRYAKRNTKATKRNGDEKPEPVRRRLDINELVRSETESALFPDLFLLKRKIQLGELRCE